MRRGFALQTIDAGTSKFSRSNLMAIPTKFDSQLAEIENAANCVLIRLRTLHHAAGANRDISGLRELLQAYVDQVMALARDGGR